MRTAINATACEDIARVKIICPNCSSAYTIADHLLGPSGRKVKCASCSKVWQAMPDETPPFSPATAGEGVTAKNDKNVESFDAVEGALADSIVEHDAIDWDEVGVAPPDGEAEEGKTRPEALASGPVDAGKRKARRRGPGKVRLKGTRNEPSPLQKFARRAMTIAAPTTVALGVLGMILAIPQRDAVVRAFPDLAALYQMVGLDVNVRGIEFSPFTAERALVAGLTVLRIEGAMTNTDDRIRSLQPLRMALLTDTGAEFFVWRVAPPSGDLLPDQTVTVSSELTAPPEAVASVSVRFLQDGERLPGEVF